MLWSSHIYICKEKIIFEHFYSKMIMRPPQQMILALLSNGHNKKTFKTYISMSVHTHIHTHNQ